MVLLRQAQFLGELPYEAFYGLKGVGWFWPPTLLVIWRGLRGVSLAAAGTAGFICLQAGRDVKSRPHGGIHEIDLNGFNTFEEIFIDHESNSLFCKNGIVIP